MNDFLIVLPLQRDAGPPPWSEVANARDDLQSVRCRGAAIWVSDGAPVLDLSEDCLVFGRLFRRADFSLVDRQSHDVRGGIESLLRDYWGAYLALECDANSITVFRDPGGQTPCYVFRRDDALILFSRLTDVIELGWITPSPDVVGMTHYLKCPGFPLQTTCLSGVNELLPGMGLRIDRSGVSLQMLWSPWRFTRRQERLSTPAEARAVLRDNLIGCVRAWGSLSQRGLLQLSGGLDSSLVGACMAPEHWRWLLLLFHPGMAATNASMRNKSPTSLKYGKPISSFALTTSKSRPRLR
ncbi:MAG: hypothetical protein ACTHLA_13490 [Asticcacaulis sp.]|uniref:hypothetical protein n=1 Tax=Asticcacaulis sp. TaxID=1872648 RepID=UPI003F7C681E